MDAKTGFFYLFSVVLLFAAFRVITARNPVHAVLYLILAFSQAAAVWLLLKAEFLAIVHWCWCIWAPSWCYSCSW
jgi:NADH-quinone oxidoreductase subunit J